MANAALTPRADSATPVLQFPHFPLAELRHRPIPRLSLWKETLERVNARVRSALACIDPLTGEIGGRFNTAVAAYERSLVGLAEMPAADLQGLCDKLEIFRRELASGVLLNWDSIPLPLALALQADARRVAGDRASVESLIENLITALDLADRDPELECSDPPECSDAGEDSDSDENDDPREDDLHTLPLRGGRV